MSKKKKKMLIIWGLASIAVLFVLFGTRMDVSQKNANNNVWAIFPPSVNNLNTCSFANGAIGDIFVKNSQCSWSDYKCTLTDYDRCYGWMEFGRPIRDACWCDSYARVCSISVSANGYTYCYKQNTGDGALYTSPCEFCVRR